ncbi:hypothetical protein JCM10212_006098 [Sporobolomyces blumeae]
MVDTLPPEPVAASPRRSPASLLRTSTSAPDASVTAVAPLPAAPTRPPLLRKNTSYASNASNGSNHAGASGSAGGCRLLWRGKIVTPEGLNLYGVAFIAHLFSVPSNLASTSTSNSPSTRVAPQTPPVPASFSPFDDPFASRSKATSSGADMCLGLEMLRGADIKLVGEPVQTIPVGLGVDADHGVTLGASLSQPRPNGKGKQREPLETIQVETPTDVRVYIDERCPETVEWFEDVFCREGSRGTGVRVDAGGEQIVIFAQAPDHPPAPETPSSALEDGMISPSTSSAESPRPALALLLGRPVKPATRKPRPDDPLPRESLFTAKLRKTASLPASAFSKGPLFPTPPTDSDQAEASSVLQKRVKPKRLSSKDKAIASLLGMTKGNDTGGTGTGRNKRDVSNPPPSIAFPLPMPVPTSASASTKRPLSRSSSTSARLFAGSEPLHPSRQSSLPSTSRPTSNGLAVPASGSRPLKRSRSTASSTSTASHLFSNGSPPPPEDVSSDQFGALDGRRSSLSLSRAASRGPSPTPSLASTTFVEPSGRDGRGGGGQTGDASDGDGQDEGEEADRLAELREIGIRTQRSRNGSTAASTVRGNARGTGGIKRSSSLPVGKFLDHRSAAGVDGEAAGKANAVKGEEGLQVNPSEVRNKNTVKKMASARLPEFGIGRDHPEFKELFSMVTRGVAFAMRATFRTQILSTDDRERAEALLEQHLRMYLPSFSVKIESTTVKGELGPHNDGVHTISKRETPDLLKLETDILDDNSLDVPTVHDLASRSPCQGGGVGEVEADDDDMDETQVVET